MSKSQKWFLFLLRVALGWLFFYAGITKVLDPAWSAAGYLKGAQHFVDFYAWLGGPTILPIVNFLNAWGLTVLGLSLLLGLWLRWSVPFGAALMALYYLPLGFPHPNPHGYIVDEHIIYILALFLLGSWRAGRVWGWDGRHGR